MTRLRDIFASLLGLTILLPLLAVVAIAVRLPLGSPTLFCQARPGQHGKLFMLRKFRTMRASSAVEDLLATDAVRLTRPGRFLRSTSLDELPTLWNVLRGDMSLVGPRPLLPEYLPLYTVQQMRRHEVKPGITGWAQVHGLRGETDTIEKMEKRVEYDLFYIEHMSLWFDLRIMAMTVFKVFAGRNAY